VTGGYFQAHTVSTDLFQPWQLTLGVAVRLTSRLLVTYDLGYAAWSEFPQPSSTLTLGLDIKQFNNQVKIPGPRTYPAPGFRDIVIPRLGVEWRAVENGRLAVDLRGGYSYEPSPVPDQTGASNFVDCDKHTFALGAGLTFIHLRPVLERPLTLDAHVAATWLPPRTTNKISPVDPVGDYVADGVVLQLAIMLGSRF
jgi:long-chain fatty acid transport protein